jgi:hypothetical protein
MQDLFRGYAVFLCLLQLIYGLTPFTRSVTNLPVRKLTLELAPMAQEDSQYKNVQVIDEQDVIRKENHP